MPGYVMQSSNAPAQGGGMNWASLGAAFAAGNVTGVTADQVVGRFTKTEARANVGMWTSLAWAGLNTLGGNAALGNANSAMTVANSITAGATYLQADQIAIKSALQQLAQGEQNLAPTGYTGISTSTQPTGAGAGAPAATTTSSNNGLVVLGLGLLFYMAVKNN